MRLQSRHHRRLIITTGSIIAALLLLLIILVVHLNTNVAQKSAAESASVATASSRLTVSSSKLASASASKSASSSAAAAKSSSAAAASTAAASTTTTAPTDIALSGYYADGSGTNFKLDIARGQLLYGGPDTPQTYNFIRTLKHADGTMVFDVKCHYQNGPHPKTIYLSILFAPAGTRFTRNWQTGATITDTSANTVNRFSVAYSKDQGKSYTMGPAYAAFAHNVTSADSQDYKGATIYTPAN